ncbi:acetyl-CoA carboxylase biotin carboxyl carrier protein subunit [Myxococcota bacterium]|nr:acetyl-CoA carboxylase biotin carboxyl carrier protein subunit [Myxococcota bacterium]MBU1430620.1 acetyl-CoA carboxylase biotin carboxyl carrier protein subunit [Myxococcota bacterium]MBU1898971.1 acetyl-CoA carboxylase biotin carboxyl carrier protein subunit [Myxococcota bacterium]
MKLKITVHGVAYEVEVEVLDAGDGFVTPRAATLPPMPSGALGNGNGHNHGAVAPLPPPTTPNPGAHGADITCPIAGIVVEIKCAVGQALTAGQTVLVLEAMKMKTNITAAAPGKVKAIPVAVGDNVREGQTLVELS